MSDGTLILLALTSAVSFVVGGWADRHLRSLRYKVTYPGILVRTVYKAVDEVIGATKEIDQNRADRRRAIIQPPLRGWQGFRRMVPKDWRQWYADFRWPIPRGTAGGPSPLPPLEVMGQYVWMGDHRYDWFIHYSTEAAASRDIFLDHLVRGHPTKGGGLALALGLEFQPEMFQVEWDRPKYQLRLTLRDAAEEVPTAPPMDVRSAT